MGVVRTIRDWFWRSAASPAVTRPWPQQSARLPAAQQRIRRWQAAETTRLNYGHWQSVTGQPINAELTGNLHPLRARSEDEISKNALVEGMISTFTLSCLGTSGPSLQIVSEDAEYNTAGVAIQKCLILSGFAWFTGALVVTETP
jgi:hypothetical protein